MKKLINCGFNMDTVCVELKYSDGSMIAIGTIAVENEVADNIQQTPALKKLMHDFSCTSAEDMNYPVLAERVRYFKEDVKGATTMCREVEKLAMEERLQGRAEGRAEAWTERTISAIRAMMDEFSVSMEDAMHIMKVPESDKETYGGNQIHIRIAAAGLPTGDSLRGYAQRICKVFLCTTVTAT